MARAAIVSVGDDERLVLRSRYDPELVDAFKDAIPREYREWDKSAKVWRIDPDWGDLALQALTDIGVSIVDKRPAVPSPTPVAAALQEACQRLYILPEAPVEVAEAAYVTWATKSTLEENENA